MSFNEIDKHQASHFEREILPLHFPRILDAVKLGIIILNADSKTLYVNECMATWLGTTVSEIKKKSVLDFLCIDEGDNDNLFNTFKNKMGAAPFNCRYKSGAGPERLLKVSVVSLEDKAVSTADVLVLLHSEVSSTGQPGKRVANTGDHRIIDSLKDYAVMTVDINRTVLSWNAGAEVIFGYSADEIIGQSSDVLFTVEDNENRVPQSEINVAYQIGHSYDDRWHLRKNGYTFYASGVMTRLSREGEAPRFIKIARDWTERKNLEEMLKNADRHKNEFLATLAHELRNPLASILSGMEVLKQEKDNVLTSKTREIIERQVQQMIHLVNDLLNISRISLGKIQLRKEIINLIDAIHLALETSRPIIEGYKHALSISLPAGPIVVNGDMTRLSQIFLNILINSAKYTAQKGKITLVVYPDKDEVVIKVSDNGMGIPPHMLSSIFEMFEQVQDKSEYPQAGLGIGLSVVKQIVQMHEGSVEAHSAGVNLGSEFTVRLPIVQDKEIAFHHNSQFPDIPIKKQVIPKKKRILLVDDNMDAADMMEVLLIKKGYIIRKAYDGRTGIATALDFNPDIVLLDLGLPDINGYDVLKTLKEKLGDKYYLALSGWGQDEDLRRTKEAGFNQHLVKPIDIQSLEEVLQKLQ